MKPLFPIVVAILVIAVNAHPENIEDIKELPQTKEPIVEAEESKPQGRKERCTACSGQTDILAAIRNLPKSEVHTQQSFEGCSSEKGCAGLKVKDGKVVEKFGNLEALKAAASADTNNEFQFHAAGNSVFEGGVPNGGPFWWMNQNSPFKGGNGQTFEKFSKSSSSSFTSSGGVDLAANPFLNGDFSKLQGSGGFTSGASNGYSNSAFGSANKEIDVSKNVFLNGGVSGFGAQGGFGSASSSQNGFASGSNSQNGFASGSNSQNGFASGSNSQKGFASGSNSQNGFGATGSQGFGGAAGFGAGSAQNGYNYNSGNKFAAGNGYVGSSPAPFAASTGSNVNLIQNTQKASEFDFGQQQQTQTIDEAFQSTGNVQANENSGGDFQQTCSGQGYVCVPRSQCNNGVVNTNGGAVLPPSSQKQYCNVRSEICCRIEATLSGAGSLQGVGSSFQGSQGSQGSSFGASGFGATGSGFSSVNKGSSFGSSFNSNQFGSNAGVSTTLAPGRFGSTQSNFIETDSFSAGSESAGVFRPGATGLKPGIPYLPPVDSSTGGSSVVSTAFPTTFVTTPRPFTTPRPVTPRPSPPSRPYLPPVPSTSAPGYLPPADTITAQESRPDVYTDGQLILDSFQPPRVTPAPPRPPGPGINDVPAGCAAALKCTPIEFCTAEGVISNTPVSLTRDQESYRVPLTDCKDIESGRIGKCCRDPLYTDPWPTNQLGKWVPGVFGGNDGKYVPDSRGSSSNTPRPQVTARPPVTGSTLENSFINPKPTPTPSYVQKQFGLGANGQGGRGTIGIVGQGGQEQFAQGSQFSTSTSQFGQNQGGQTVVQGQGSYSQGGRGQQEVIRQGQGLSQGVGTITTQGQGFGVNRGVGVVATQGGGQTIRQNAGFGINRGGGVGITQGAGFGVTQGSGTAVTQSGGFGISQGSGSTVSQGAGYGVSQGGGYGVTQGSGLGVSQGAGFGINGGRGTATTQGAGFGVTQQKGVGVIQGQGVGVTQGGGFGIIQGSGTSVSQGGGFGVTQGQGTTVSQGGGFGVTQGQGTAVSQGGGFGVTQGQGTAVSQGGGFGVTQGQGSAVTQGVGSSVSRGQGFGVSQGQGFGVSQGQGLGVSQGQGFGVSQGQGFGVSQGQGFGVSQGQGFGVSQGQGQAVSQGQGQGIRQGFGTGVYNGQGAIVTQGQGQGISRGQGFGLNRGIGYGVLQGQGQTLLQGQGQALIQGQGEKVEQGFGTGIKQGGGFSVSQGGGYGVENDYSESVQRVFLTKYGGSGECGILNPQKPYGNRKELEVDFAEIPWQAMVLLQTNRSLLCGGVITRPDVVITSASCVDGLDAKNVLIKGGEWKLGIDDEPLPFQIVQVKHILRHPFYKVGSLKYDAAVLVLTENLRLAKNIWPICLPSANESLEAFYNGGGQCVVTGWGKQVLQAHLEGSIMHSIDVSLTNPGQCQTKISQDYPHLLEQYDQESCVCGQPKNPVNNICRVDIGSALACTTDDSHYVLRGVYSWDSGCQTGNQLAAFYRFDLEWYEWAIGLTESVRFAQYGKVTKKITTQTKTTTYTSGAKGVASGIKGFTRGQGQVTSGIKGFTQGQGQVTSGFGATQGQGQIGFGQGQTQFSGVKGFTGTQEFNLQGKGQAEFTGVKGLKEFGIQGQGQTGQFTDLKGLQGQLSQFGAGQTGEVQGPISNTFTATYTEKKFFQTEPKIVTYTTKPEIVTFTTKPEYFTYTTKPEIVTYTTKPKIVTYTTKPKIVTYTTKPEIVTYTTKPEIVTFTTKPEIVSYTTKPQYIRYETSGTRTNPTYVAPDASLNPSFSEIVGAKHKHSAACKCLENSKK